MFKFVLRVWECVLVFLLGNFLSHSHVKTNTASCTLSCFVPSVLPSEQTDTRHFQSLFLFFFLFFFQSRCAARSRLLIGTIGREALVARHQLNRPHL